MVDAPGFQDGKYSVGEETKISSGERTSNVKGLESRISSLEKRLIPQLPDMSVIQTTIGTNIFHVGGVEYQKPDDVEQKEFLDGLMQQGLIAKNRVVVNTVYPSDDGK